MLKATERRVKYFDCRVTAKVRGVRHSIVQVQPVSMLRIVQELEYLVNQGIDVRTETVGELQAWRLADVEVCSKRSLAILLINRVDSEAADQAIEHRDTGSFRVATKDDREANAYSAHVAISLQEKNGVYRMVVEEAGVSSQRVAMLFAKAFKASQDAGRNTFMYPNPSGALDSNGNIKISKGLYSARLTGHPSDQFIKELDSGSLRGIEIINGTSTTQGWDQYNATEELSTSVRLKPLKSTVSNYSIAKSVLSQAKRRKMSEIRVKFDDPEGDERTLTFDVDTGQILNEDRYVKRGYLRNFSDRLDTGFQKVHPEIRDKMFYLLR